MTKHYEQRKKSNEKYLSKFDEIRIRLLKGEKEKLKMAADAENKSINQYIRDIIFK